MWRVLDGICAREKIKFKAVSRGEGTVLTRAVREGEVERNPHEVREQVTWASHGMAVR